MAEHIRAQIFDRRYKIETILAKLDYWEHINKISPRIKNDDENLLLLWTNDGKTRVDVTISIGPSEWNITKYRKLTRVNTRPDMSI